MPAAYYIHNIYNADISSQFGKQQIQRQLNFQLTQLNTLNKAMKANYKKIFGAVTPYNQAVKELERILPQAARAMVANLPTVNFSAIRQALAIHNVDMLQAAVDKMRKDLTEYENVYNNITGDNDTSLGSTWFSEADLKRLAGYRERISKAKANLDKLDLSADNVWGIQKGLATVIATVSGYISEYSITDLLNKFSAQTGISFTQAGTQGDRATGYATQTSDIQINLSPTSGTISGSLPGITLKRTGTGTKKNPSINIHLKSTSVGQLIKLSDMASGGFNLETFYNAYANAGRTTLNFETQSEVVNQVKGMTNLYRAFKTAALATALTGSMNTSDFAYYLVVNDEVYTATEIITGVLNGNGSIVNGQQLLSLKNMNPDQLLGTKSAVSIESAQPLIAQKHTQLLYSKYLTAADDSTEADLRSAEVINMINALNTSLNLKINLSQLTR